MTKKIAFLSGGVGGARFAHALHGWSRRSGEKLECTAIVNVGDDLTHFGLRISPDIDSVTYHLAGMGDRERGWGRASDTESAMTEMRRVLPEDSWFQLGDLDIAHSLMRTHLLNSGASLSVATRTLNSRYGVEFSVLPVTDDESPTVVSLDPDGNATMGFQEWWVRNKAEPLPHGFIFPAAESATPAPGVLESIAGADLIVIAPSNPVVSITPMLAIPGIRAAIASATAPVVGISPIIGGRPVRGWLDRCLTAVGLPCSAAAVAELYGHRQAKGLLDGWMSDPEDEGLATSFAGPMAFVPLRFRLDARDDDIIEALFAIAADITSTRETELSV